MVAHGNPLVAVVCVLGADDLARRLVRVGLQNLLLAVVLPDHIQQAIDDFKASEWIGEILGADVQGRFADLKQAAADRSPKDLGTFVKGSEVQYHHEVYNQSLWNLLIHKVHTRNMDAGTRRRAQR